MKALSLFLLLLSCFTSKSQDFKKAFEPGYDCCNYKVYGLGDVTEKRIETDTIQAVVYRNYRNTGDTTLENKVNYKSITLLQQQLQSPLVRKHLKCIRFEDCSLDSNTITLLYQLTELRTITMDNVQLIDTIYLARLKNLSCLVLHQVKLIDKIIFANSINTIKSLTINSSYVTDNFFMSICNNRKLKYFKLVNTDVKHIPNCICNLKKLESLILINTQLEELPDCIAKLNHINLINITRTSINKIPESMYKIKNLRLVISGGCDNIFGGFEFNRIIDLFKKSKNLNWDIRILEE
ncbi:hypothetical protein CAP35_01740 [Chitinophagaceae bacterium IBVUCB1]|nr:hypothetical protein CAP35_01740 [Chitinophagaceae bacterium IBVUCB1]